MYDEAMAAAVERAQKRLMNTEGSGSVLNTAAADLTELTELIEKLDPSKIDFDKGGLSRIKAVNYWNRFEELYPSLKAMFDKMGRSRNILYNSIKTVKKLRDDYMAEYERFRAVPADRQDERYIQQAMVCENMSQLLKNTVTEHEAMYDFISKLLNVFEDSLSMSIFFALRKFNRSLDGTGIKALPSSDVTNMTFQAQYRRLSDTISGH